MNMIDNPDKNYFDFNERLLKYERKIFLVQIQNTTSKHTSVTN